VPKLDWLTRSEDEKVSAHVPYRLLEAVPEHSYGDPGSENMLIQGDNLDPLKALLPFYAGRVKCIFIDPPYNTRAHSRNTMTTWSTRNHGTLNSSFQRNVSQNSSTFLERAPKAGPED
jgi:16S rRNA G966 N2-methylase RsmD